MDNNIIKLIEQYIELANKIATQMMLDFNVSNKQEFIKRKSLYLSGEMSVLNVDKYIFHGRGCRYIDNNGKLIIDWDFGYGDLWVGVNTGLFQKYLKDNNFLDSSICTYEYIKNELDKLVGEGILYIKYGLYYLA